MKLTEEQILKKASELAKINHAHSSELEKDKSKALKNPELKYPEYFDGYREICTHYDSILVHSMKGVFPEHLFVTRAPNMEQKEFDYLKANYKQVTLSVFKDFVNSIYKAFNDGNWSIDIPEKLKTGDDNFLKYINEEISIYRSLETWMKTILIPCKLRDAMGVVAVKPGYEYVLDSENESEEIYKVDDSVLPKPIPVYYDCKHVVTKCLEKYTAILLDDKSTVSFGNKLEKSGLIFEFYDDGTIYRVEQVGKKVDFNFTITKQEVTGLKYSSVSYMMGDPIIKDSKFVYESPFLYSVDELDLVSVTQSYLQAIEAKCVFPFTIMVGNECDFSSNGAKCIGGSLYDGAQVKQGTCIKCNGSGTKTRISALGTMMLRPEEIPNLDVDKVLKYVSPETTTNDFLIKEIQRHKADARAILHLGQTEGDVKGSATEDTASGKWIDQKNHYAFIKPISDQLFYIYEFVINTISLMRTPTNTEKIVVNAPISFEFNTEADYIEQIKSAKDAGLPDALIFPIIYKFLSSLYYTESKTMAIFSLLINADRLLLMDKESVNLGMANNSILPWEKYLHDSWIVLTNELIREDEKFLEKDLVDQITKLKELATTQAPKIQTTKVEPISLF